MQQLVRYLILIILSSIVFIPFLGHVHLFDWDEINFAECAREMLATKDYLRAQINFHPFWEKPPLFIWLQALSMKMFGVNEFAARFPNAVTGIITICLLFHIGTKIINERMGIWWATLYAATWLPHFYFKSGIIDPVFNLFIFSAFYQMHLVQFSKDKLLPAFLCGLFIGLAVLTKGPVAILVAGLCLVAYTIYNRGLEGCRPIDFLVITGGLLSVFVAWFTALIYFYGWAYFQWFFSEFITYQIRLFSTEDADHGGPFFYHFLVLLVGCFPASIFLFQYIRQARRFVEDKQVKSFTKWMWVLFWVVLILFSIVKTKIVHYSSLCYFPISFLAAVQVYRLSENKIRVKQTIKVLLLLLGSILGIAITLLPIVGIFKTKLIPYINDPFAVGNLQAAIRWHLSECLYGLVYLIGIWVVLFRIRRQFNTKMAAFLILQILMIELIVLHFTPKIEGYSQNAAIVFYQKLKGKDVYIHVLGYKSFAQYFYTDMQRPANPNYYNEEGKANEEWLLHGALDKPAYFVTKIQNVNYYLQAIPDLKELYRKNGFAFLIRQPKDYVF